MGMRSTSSSWPGLAMDASGTPYVAWGESIHTSSDSYYYIYLRSFDGLSWHELGTSASSSGVSGSVDSSRQVSIAIDNNGFPVVAWQESTLMDWQIYLRRWNGAVWVGLGNTSPEGIHHHTPYRHGRYSPPG